MVLINMGNIFYNFLFVVFASIDKGEAKLRHAWFRKVEVMGEWHATICVGQINILLTTILFYLSYYKPSLRLHTTFVQKKDYTLL